MVSSQASYAGTPETHNSSYIIVNEHACLESNYWRSEDDSPLLEDRSYEVFHLPSNILNGETDFPVSQAAETLNTSLEKKFNETMANQQSVLPDSDTITNVNMDWSRTVNGVVKRYQLSLNHTKQGLERRVRGLKSNCTESMGNAIVVNLNEMLVKKHYTVAPTISDLLFPERGNENQVFLVLGKGCCVLQLSVNNINRCFSLRLYYWMGINETFSWQASSSICSGRTWRVVSKYFTIRDRRNNGDILQSRCYFQGIS
jgi:hypothetical protein